MCGIVGLYLKNSDLHSRIGELITPMLDCMGDRGPDSAGLAIYRDEAPAGTIKITVRKLESDAAWSELSQGLSQRFGCDIPVKAVGSYAVIIVPGSEGDVLAFVASEFPSFRVMSAGRKIEIFKETGRPEEISERLGFGQLYGSHAVGHTRMATESAVTTDGSHPFSTGMDLCLVHNGSLSNYSSVRENLQRRGIEFRTENDSEVAAGYLMWRMREGDSLNQALESALDDLDGFYTFAIGTSNGFAVLRDPIACKPAVMVETDDYVAMASEYRALADLPGIENARQWEPEPAIVYTWGDD
ncbi:MAG: glutamine amidotransferase family protein [Verrucomicrobia bacterium]|nr:glutamine amidotransferase family protein [Verrucomicrobiota bacterium]MDA1085689.1 glutamine amidotransferase family protein [Verrucomicrobiota bacterium]